MYGDRDVGWWHLTEFYGDSDTNKRPKSWKKLRHLRKTSELPWLVIGDFNEITSMYEKGGSVRPRQQMGNIVDTLNRCSLKDLGFVGPNFTWLYQTAAGDQIRERLDRALATSGWMELFPDAKLFHLTSSASDHSPLSLHLVGKRRKQKMSLVFRFESMWLKEPRCEEIVHEAWEEGKAINLDCPLTLCLDRCRARLEDWNKVEFGHVGKTIVDLQKNLEWLERQPMSPENIRSMRATQVNLNCWLEKEDSMWL